MQPWKCASQISHCEKHNWLTLTASVTRSGFPRAAPSQWLSTGDKEFLISLTETFLAPCYSLRLFLHNPPFFFSFNITVLLKYNLHTMEFAHLKYELKFTVFWYFQRTDKHHYKINFRTPPSLPTFPWLFDPKQPLTEFLSLYSCLSELIKSYDMLSFVTGSFHLAWFWGSSTL